MRHDLRNLHMRMFDLQEEVTQLRKSQERGVRDDHSHQRLWYLYEDLTEVKSKITSARKCRRG